MDVIIAPIITESSMKDAKASKFTFRVNKKSNKYQIKNAVEKNFKVNVVHISTMNLKGKTIRTGVKRMEKKISGYKKAIVTLKKDQKIGLFELGEDKDK